ncbi:MAG: hypothetical protein HFACDABA_02017 [Anaerolineales bacterium]|nr:hypothetical protein [Anaerolineales bacterium]
MLDLFNRFLIRVLSSRFARRWFAGLSSEERATALLQFWRGANTGLNDKERYLLVRKAYDDRRMKNYALQRSGRYARIYGFFRLIEELGPVQGDIVECGVGRGISLACLVYAVSFFRLEKMVYGFDSFSGFPPATVQDIGTRVTTVDKPPTGWGDTSPDLIRSIFECDRAIPESLLRAHDVRLEIVPGFFHETLSNNLPKRIAFLHVDCDMYESTKIVLEHGLPRMSPGGIVIFDEYHDEHWPGAKKAADEVCAARGLKIEYLAVAGRYGIRIPQ